MNYTKEELEFFKQNDFTENYPYGMRFDLRVTVKGDHADDCACVYYGRNKLCSKLVYESTLLEMMLDYISYGYQTADEFKEMKEELFEDIQIWLGKLNKAADTNFYIMCINVPMIFYMRIDIKDMDFQATSEKIRKFAVLMDKSLKQIYEKVCEENSWNFKFCEAPVADIMDIDND